MDEPVRRRPGRPPNPPLHETAAFKEAVAAAAAAAVAEALALRAIPETQAGNTMIESLRDLIGEMANKNAAAMAEVADQGTGRRRVAPEIVARRKAAAARCGRLIEDMRKRIEGMDFEEAKAQGLVPEYRVIATIVFNEQVVQPFRMDNKQPVPNEIWWTGMPNMALTPINDVAKAIYREFMLSNGSSDLVGIPNDNRPMWVTANGLTVKGTAPQKRFVAAPPEFPNQFSEKSNNDPTKPFVNVLGTIADPARQNVSGQH